MTQRKGTILAGGFGTRRDNWNPTPISQQAEPQGASDLSFAQRVNQRFKGLAGDELSLPTRQTARAAPNFEQS